MNKTHFLANSNPKALFYLLILNLFLFASCADTQKTPAIVTKNLRTPAYPLVTIDPYMSAWSETDHLYDDAVRHWTGKRQGLIGALGTSGIPDLATPWETQDIGGAIGYSDTLCIYLWRC